MIRQSSSVMRTISLLLGLLFQIIPLPSGLDLARPYLLALFICYWCLETPEKTGLGTAFIFGLWISAFRAMLAIFFAFGENFFFTLFGREDHYPFSFSFTDSKGAQTIFLFHKSMNNSAFCSIHRFQGYGFIAKLNIYDLRKIGFQKICESAPEIIGPPKKFM